MYNSTSLLNSINKYFDSKNDTDSTKVKKELSKVEKELTLLKQDTKQKIIEIEDLDNLLSLIICDDKLSNQIEIQKFLTKIQEVFNNEEKRKILNYHLLKELNYTETNYSIEYLVTEFSTQRMQMPKYQRSFVWNISQVGELIFSLLRGIPIPKLYGYSVYNEISKKNIKLIVDGQQRLTSILMYYYGIFPKYKVRAINYSEHMTEIVELCNYYYDPETYKRVANMINDEKGRKSMLDEIDNAKETLEKKYKLDLDVEFKVRMTNETNATNEINISYRHKDSILLPKEKNDLLEKELGFVLIKGDPSASIDIFTLYNSAGTSLSDQEIRNGVYYRNPLYELINKFNDNTGRKEHSKEVENENWNNIRTTATEKADVQQLFSMLARSFELDKTNKIKDIIENDSMQEILTDKQSDSINNYSNFIGNHGNNKELIDKEYQSLVNFFSLNFEKQRESGKNFKNYLATFVILKLEGFLNQDINYKEKTISKEILAYSNEASNNLKGYLSVTQIKYIYNQLKEDGIF